MAKSNQILDTDELLKRNFNIAFSSYWQKIEPLIKRAHIALGIILILILGSVLVRHFRDPHFADLSIQSSQFELFILIFSLPIPFAIIIFIQQFQKFRNRVFKEKTTNGRLSRLLIFSSIFILFSSILFALSILVLLFLIYMFFIGSPDPEGIKLLAIYIIILFLSGFQTFYLGYSILYLIECNKLKKQYVST